MTASLQKYRDAKSTNSQLYIINNITLFRKKSYENVRWLVKNCVSITRWDTELAWAVDIMMACEKREFTHSVF